MKLSFKNQEKPSGLAAIVNPYNNITIRGDGKSVGNIFYQNKTSAHPEHDSKWHIQFHVKSGSSWNNVTIKASFNNEQEAKEFITKHWPIILSKYQLHQLDY